VPFLVVAGEDARGLLRIGQYRVGGRPFVGEDAAHAAHHVVEDVAVEEPVARFGGGELDGVGLHGHDVQHVLQRGMVALAVHHPEEVAVQVHGVAHHAVVVEDDAHVLALADQDAVGLRNGLVVDGPEVAVHVAGELEAHLLHRPGRQRGAHWVSAAWRS
jgi:hypothetical protein